MKFIPEAKKIYTSRKTNNISALSLDILYSLAFHISQTSFPTNTFLGLAPIHISIPCSKARVLLGYPKYHTHKVID